MFTVLNLVYIVVVLVSVSLTTEVSSLKKITKKQNKHLLKDIISSGEWTFEPCTSREVQIMHNVNIPFAPATLWSNQTPFDERAKHKNIKRLN